MNEKIMKQVSENEDTAIKLLKENVELKERINNAIKYINRNTINSDFYEAFDGNIDDLLEILKGSDK